MKHLFALSGFALALGIACAGCIGAIDTAARCRR